MSSLQVLELNDRAVRLADGSGLITASPGFALAQGKNLELGEMAEQQARLHPTSSFDKFWQQLSLEPMNHGSGAIRHLADLAYAHLQHVAMQAGVDAGSDQQVILAVPGNFDRQQLAIALGLIQQSSFAAVGMIDSALAAATATMQSSTVIYADIQLHQVLLTKVSNRAGQLGVDSVVQVPGVGTQNFMNLMMQLVTGLFIQQCRFNPQHDADSEQQLYNALPGWLNQDEDSDNSLVLELSTDNAVHQAKLTQQSLVDNLTGHYQNISRQISALVESNGGSDTTLVISQALANLPGFNASVNHQGKTLTLGADAISQACLHHATNIVSGAEAVHLVTSLAVDTAVGVKRSEHVDSAKIAVTDNSDVPTHALYSDRAFALDKLALRSARSLNGNSTLLHAIALQSAALSDHLGQFECQGDQIFLQCGEHGTLLNSRPITGRQSLQLGDQISFENSNENIRLIRVDN